MWHTMEVVSSKDKIVVGLKLGLIPYPELINPPQTTGAPWAQRLINLEIPVLVRSLKSSNVELG